jgi:hypothetical protein
VTDAWHVGDLFLSGGESHEDALAVSRVWLTRLLDEDLEDHAFGERFAFERLALGTVFDVRASHVHLIQRCHVASCQRCYSCKERTRTGIKIKSHLLGMLRTITVSLTGTITAQSSVSPFHHLLSAPSRNNDRI